MTRSNDDGAPCRHRLARAAAVVALVVVAACSDGGEPIATTDTVELVPSAPTTGKASTDTPTTSTIPMVEDGPLAESCPQQISIQTASLPSPAVGPLYELLGDDPVVDPGAQTVTAPLVRTDGTVEDVELQIRSGGPAVGFTDPLSLLSSDEGLLLAQVSTAVALRDVAATPSVGVVTLTDRSRDSVIVDPATYPGVDTMEGVRDLGIEVRHVTKEPFVTFLAATGALSADQLVSGFDGEPASFVQADGAIAQQGDLTIEPVLLPALPQWGRPVTAIDAASAGWDVHDDALVVRPADVDDLRTCLGRLVPVIQDAIAAYMADSTATNTAMSQIRSRFAPLNRLTPELMDAGLAQGIEFGVFGDGANATVGDFDIDRVDAFLPDLTLALALGVEAASADDLMTNEFIDPTITSAG